MFTKNDLGEYWQAYCMICTGDVFSYKVDDVHYLFEDGNLVGRPICKGCYEELKDKILNHIDLIKKQEKERTIIRKKFWKNIESLEKKRSLDKWI